MKNETTIQSPKENQQFFGHEQAQKIMLEAFANGNMPNAWLISGPKGIGKATLAYRFARFLLTNSTPQSQDGGLFGDMLAPVVPETLDVNWDNPIISRIQAGSHGDLLVVDTENSEDEDKVKREIGIEKVREINSFLSLTPSEAERRVVIIDSADEMNRSSANAVLKILEEPPSHSVLLLISHSPGRLLPTIRSRCRFIKLKSLPNEDVEKVLSALIPEISEEDLRVVSLLSDGSPGLAAELYVNGGVELYKKIIEIFAGLPNQNISAIDSLGEKVEGKRNLDNWKIFAYLMQYFLAEIVRVGVNDNNEYLTEALSGENELKRGLAKQYTPAGWSDLWQRVGQISAEAEYANLDKKHALINMFSTICKEVA